MGKALKHIALYVSDIEASTSFYKDWAGMKVVHVRKASDEHEIRWLSSPGYEDSFIIALIPGREMTRTSKDEQTYLNVEIKTEVEFNALMEQARQETKIHWFYQQSEHPARAMFTIKDPDGYIVEFSVSQSQQQPAFEQQAEA